jgi:uncharacterized protein (DUF2267 family)
LTESARQDKATQLAAYMYAIVNANSRIMEETMKVKEKRKTFHQIVEEAGFTAEWEARGEAKGEARVIALLKKGLSLEEIEKVLAKPPALV